MAVSLIQTGLFLLAAIALLGSPGPGIAALVAVGKDKGLVRGLPFFGGMQAGLAVAAALSAAGLASALATIPSARLVMSAIATLYLLYLGYRLATAPTGADATSSAPSSVMGGVVLGLANPKAYLAFISLFGSFTLTQGRPDADALIKWLLCVAVMIVVDLAWLWLGAVIGGISLRPVQERVLNVAMGGTVAATALLAIG